MTANTPCFYPVLRDLHIKKAQAKSTEIGFAGLTSSNSWDTSVPSPLSVRIDSNPDVDPFKKLYYEQ
jgi:hypothetical protein